MTEIGNVELDGDDGIARRKLYDSEKKVGKTRRPRRKMGNDQG